MTLPARINALILKNDGFAATRTGAGIDSLDPYLSFSTLPLPQPHAGQVLVKLRMASVNPSDLYFIKGEYGQARVKGAAAGFEGVGDVIDGKGLHARYLKGKRVAFVGGVSGSGAWAEYIVVPAATCVVVKPAMRDEDAAGHVVNPVTAWTMFDIVKKSGSKSFVFTAAFSQLGKLMAGLARDNGYAMIAVIRKDSQAAHLKALGAKHVLIQSDPDFAAKLAALMASEKPRILLDAVANQLAADIFTAMPARARWVIYGKLDTETPVISEPGQFIFMDKKIEGYWLSKWFRNASWLEKIKALRAVQNRFISGAWKTEVVATVKLSDAMQDLPDALKLGDGKVMIVP
ncbi:zinc-binding dehydrogenase [Hoeflea sp. YIM 152468]|uniref:alcohol dehydrogenase catalytic domain-containing protein n=1 Tax=Hoeflea sp. YIM 152468 TaxID=3031759 RepID=UPI0023DB96FB|nr:zinc-binding dehydrogenase [Hoeflea sp. YIM 152468]MDF1609035.1 zinc-binding dehydrogenase [Hoeflea sp. YIM 152468]